VSDACTTLCFHHCHLLLQSLIKAFRLACTLAVQKVKDLSVSLEDKSDEEKRSLLKKCAMTTLNSKLVRWVPQFTM
jgi:T-complex protein 1 subunit eta